MIDLKDLREHPDRYRDGAAAKNIDVDIDRLLELDTDRRRLMAEQEAARAEQNKISKEIGPQIGKLKSQLKKADGDEKAAIEAELKELESRPATLKVQVQSFDEQIAQIEPEWHALTLKVPLPPDPDVPRGKTADDNVQLRTWNPPTFDPAKPFADNKGFPPRTHMEIAEKLGLVDFERGVKMAGTRHYVLTGDGARLHQAILRYAFDTIINQHGFKPMTIPVIVREEMMVGTGFFPAGRDQAYALSNYDTIDEYLRESAEEEEAEDPEVKHVIEGYLTGTGEVSLMGMHEGEILDADQLPLQYATVSTCFRREAGAAGRDTAGLYRIHQFEKVEQVVICRADEQESRKWHQTMIAIVEQLLQSLELPYRLLQCCTGDLGPKNADMIDLECWMPGRGELDDDDRPQGAYGETHSASRLYDYQCRRLNLRYRGEETNNKTVFCHSLNNTVIASPRILIPLLEINQNEDGTVTVPSVLRPYMNGQEKIEK